MNKTLCGITGRRSSPPGCRPRGHFAGRSFLARCLMLAFFLALPACSTDFFLTSHQLENRARAILETPYSPAMRETRGESDARLLALYLERAHDGTRRVEAYERLILLNMGAVQYTDIDSAMEDMYAEFIGPAHPDPSTAYKACELYLRYNPEGVNRYGAWNRLALITTQIRGNRELGVQILEAMADEFDHEPQKLRAILLRKAETEEELRRLPEAAETWGRLLDLPDISAEDIVAWSSQRARVYFLQRDFASSEEVLKACFERTSLTPVSARCLLDLGTMYLAQEMLDEVAVTMRRALEIPGIDEDLRSRAVFELADIEYQLGHYDEARNLFEEIRHSYPNPMVIDARLRMIEEKEKSR